MLGSSDYFSRLPRCVIAGILVVFIFNGCGATNKSKLYNIEDNAKEEVKLVDGPNCTVERQKDYFNKVRMKIVSKWKDPNDSERKYSEDIVTIHFTVSRPGDVLSINVLESSGNKVLDDIAIQAIKDASPVDMVPECIDNTVTILKIKARFVYRLGAKKEIRE